MSTNNSVEELTKEVAKAGIDEVEDQDEEEDDHEGEGEGEGPTASSIDATGASTGAAASKKNKKKKKKPAAKTAAVVATAVESTEAPAAAAGASVAVTGDIAKATEIANMIALSSAYMDEMKKREAKRAAKKKEQPETKEHKFWSTQPVLAMDQVAQTSGPVDRVKTVEEIKPDPYPMPAGFEWFEINLDDPEQIQQMYDLLTHNYVEDDECTFRFDYSIDFLKWALEYPGYFREWIVGVRSIQTKKYMACITGIPVKISINGTPVSMCEINFLCVHKKLREKRLAPVLIKEITRRVNRRNIWQAVYTAGAVLPKPVAQCRYYHRSINVQKLVEIRFTYVPAKTTLASHIRANRLRDAPVHPFRPFQMTDSIAVQRLLQGHLNSTTKMHMVWSLEEILHVFTPRKGVIDTFVLEDEHGQVANFLSFYHLPSSILAGGPHKTLFSVYSYYNVATTISYEELMADALVLAKLTGTDVFNALDLMQNESVFASLKFGQGDGHLQYYLYNWQTPELAPRDVGLVLL